MMVNRKEAACGFAVTVNRHAAPTQSAASQTARRARQKAKAASAIARIPSRAAGSV